jgi:hypothetical protein
MKRVRNNNNPVNNNSASFDTICSHMFDTLFYDHDYKLENDINTISIENRKIVYCNLKSYFEKRDVCSTTWLKIQSKLKIVDDNNAVKPKENDTGITIEYSVLTHLSDLVNNLNTRVNELENQISQQEKDIKLFDSVVNLKTENLDQKSEILSD